MGQKEMNVQTDCERLLETLSREIGQFEGKVADLEAKCTQIRSRIAGLAREIRGAGSSLPPNNLGTSPNTKAHEGDSLAAVVESSGMKDHVELVQGKGDGSDIIIHEPGGAQIAVYGLSGAPEQSEIAEVSSRLIHDRAGSSSLHVMYVPAELDLPLVEGMAAQGIVVASPSVLFSILRGVALQWLSFACGQNARAIVDGGQDLVDELSAFIADFTESEKALCALVDTCAQASRRREQARASRSG